MRYHNRVNFTSFLSFITLTIAIVFVLPQNAEAQLFSSPPPLHQKLCEDAGLVQGKCIPGSCPAGHQCENSVVKDPGGAKFDCHSCINVSEVCEDQDLFAGSCPGMCSSGQLCHEAPMIHKVNKQPVDVNCHQCEDVSQLCESQGALAGSCSSSPCEASGMICQDLSYRSRIDKGMPIACYVCENLAEICEDQDLFAGPCPGLCSDDEVCKGVPVMHTIHGNRVGLNCHSCEKASKVCTGKYKPGSCPQLCPENHVCRPDQSGMCWTCTYVPPEQDDEKPKTSATSATDTLSGDDSDARSTAAGSNVVLAFNEGLDAKDQAESSATVLNVGIKCNVKTCPPDAPASVSFSGNQVTIDPVGDLFPPREYDIIPGSIVSLDNTEGIDCNRGGCDFVFGQQRGNVDIEVLEEEFLTPSSANTTAYIVSNDTIVEASQDTISTDNLYEFTGIEEGVNYNVQVARPNWASCGEGACPTGDQNFYMMEGGAGHPGGGPVILSDATLTDAHRPYLTATSPTRDSDAGVAALGSDAVLTFNENIDTPRTSKTRVGVFTVSLRVGKVGVAGPTIRNVPATVSISGNQITINPTDNLLPAQTYTITGDRPAGCTQSSCPADQRYTFTTNAGNLVLTPPDITQVPNTADNQMPIFADGFESGDTSAWSSDIPGTTPTTPPPPPQVAVADTRPLIRLPDGRMMRVSRIEVTTIIIIIETPHGRFVLKREGDKEQDFIPSQIMALAKVDANGNILNTLGQAVPPSDFLGSFGSRFSGAGIPHIEQISLKDLSDQLKDDLMWRKKFGHNCFKEYKDDDADLLSKEKKKDKKKKEKKSKALAPSEDQIRKGEEAGIPAVTGPIIACGEADGKKALSVYDSGGSLVTSVTQELFRTHPNIILDALRVAQASSDDYTKMTKMDIDLLSRDFRPLEVGNIQRAPASEPPSKKKKKKKKKKAEAVVEPNDPLYQEKKKKKRFLGILGGDSPSIKIGGGVSMGGIDITNAAGSGKKAEIKDQYGLRQIGFTSYADPESAWNVINAETKNITVAVIDSGLDMDHPDRPRYIWTNTKEVPGNAKDDDQNGFIDDIHGWNFLNADHDFRDYRGHGTFVAGIIAARTNNGIGIAGINPGAVIMPVKVANENGETNSFDIYRGINYAVTHGARVINVSLGARMVSALEQVAISRAQKMGAFVVVASGNGGESILGFGPASAHHAFAVGATDFEYRRSTISNHGPNNALMAPGEEIFSLASKNNKHVKASIRKSGYYSQSGTSFSAPMVAATASLLLAKDPSLTNTQLADLLMGTATPMNGEGWKADTGAGFLNATAALRSSSKKYLTVMFTDLKINKNQKKKNESVDVFATVRGTFKDYVIEAGKGRRAKKFKQIAGPFTREAVYNFIARINVKEHLRGGDVWMLRIKATDTAGKTHFATTPLEFK